MIAVSKSGRPARIIELGTYGQARYARMSTGETIWWGSEEDVPDQVARAAAMAEVTQAAGTKPEAA
ncbi:hypothetical protein [Methylobacterium sp. ID0610]|uniref:hypothetical protein n=1 Tax=Methylobacterium carpenticola TaxID=3344827 RepID=UPI003693EE5E